MQAVFLKLQNCHETQQMAIRYARATDMLLVRCRTSKRRFSFDLL